MPTLSIMNIPLPVEWNEFELITLTALKIKWQSPNLQRNGRSGQVQSGVDIYGVDYIGRLSGIQCKKLGQPLTMKYIEAQVKKAEKFKPALLNFYIATTAPNDSSIQQQVRLLSEKRIAKGKFPVGIFFWEDIIQDLIKNEAEFQIHYPQIALKSTKEPDVSFRSIFDLVYYGLTLRYKIQLIFGEAGEWANENPLGVRYF